MSVSVRFGQMVCHVLCFVGALSLAGAGLQQLRLGPHIPQISEKLEQFRAEGPFDVVFLGSSKVFRGVVPAVFDAEVGARGQTVRSYNLGVDGMGFPESAHLFDQLPARERGALRWVFVELSGVRTTLQPAELGTIRELYWHDWQRTLWVCRSLLSGEAGPAPLPLLGRHLRLFARRGLAIGQGAERMPILLGAQKAPVVNPQFIGTAQGYDPMPFGLTSATTAQFQEQLAELKTEPPRPGAPASGASLRQFARQVARHGAQVIYFVPPNSLPTRRHLEAGATGPIPPLWAFDDPAEYAALYDLENRADALHLNDRGARAFTQVLAARFSRELAPQPTAPAGKGVAR